MIRWSTPNPCRATRGRPEPISRAITKGIVRDRGAPGVARETAPTSGHSESDQHRRGTDRDGHPRRDRRRHTADAEQDRRRERHEELGRVPPLVVAGSVPGESAGEKHLDRPRSLMVIGVPLGLDDEECQRRSGCLRVRRCLGDAAAGCGIDVSLASRRGRRGADRCESRRRRARRGSGRCLLDRRCGRRVRRCSLPRAGSASEPMLRGGWTRWGTTDHVLHRERRRGQRRAGPERPSQPGAPVTGVISR